MKVLKTIVATTVIVFTLTTVAMAGVHRFTQHAGATTQRLGATVPAAHAAGTFAHAGTMVTLTERQFDRMLSQMRSGRPWMMGGVSGQTVTPPAAQGRDNTRGNGIRTCPRYGSQSGSGDTWRGGSMMNNGGMGGW
jgi:hypothetical protein